MPQITTCLRALNYFLSTCLKLLRAYVPTCPYFSRASIPSFFTCLRAYVCIYTFFHAYVRSCLKLFPAYIFHVLTCLQPLTNILRLTSILCSAAFLWIICQSSHRRCSLRNRVLRNFAKLTGKHLWPATLLKKRLWHRCFPVNVAKFLRTMFYGTPLGDCFCIWPSIPFKTPKTNSCF